MDDQKPSNVFTAPRAAGCTSLERRLASWCCFRFTLILNAILRVFVWPHVSGSPYLILVVVGTRMGFGVSWVRLHQYLTGEQRIDPLVATVVWFLSTIIVDLALGSSYRSYSVKDWVAQGYCKNR
ncbi:hypothetical protein N658DRAFT_500031 [Parathielavia hyrcaniae]|uniref:Uncharacterized protein n=1 Tax=Parathielavia hyrcaniae TaxID=113614 RepID=A0AAN6SXV2_9PEZI|nr:hypothetical protein N658DRAFT_500031 [Parathielavia hyrcaniae]